MTDIAKLNEIRDFLNRNPALADCVAQITYSEMHEIAEAFRAMEQRAEVAEAEQAKLHVEIYRLQEEVRGPDGFATWKDAAIALKLAAKNTGKDIDYLTAMSAFHSDDWHRMDPITGYMKGWNARPAPAIDLAELLEVSANKTADQIYHLFDGIYDDRSRAWSLANDVWDACHAAILRNIEEQSQ